MPFIGANTNFIENGIDIGSQLVTKEYLIDVYPSLVDEFRIAGLWGWGNNENGQLGTNDITHRSSPVQTVAGGINWKQIDNGENHTAAIKADGTLWLWGDNFYGQLGTNDINDRSSPVQTVSGGTNWKQVACGSRHTGAIKTDGTLWLWGDNGAGRLGDNTRTRRSSPVQTVSGGNNWKQVACGLDHTAAIKTDGTLWLWGENNIGQLGTNDINDRSSPVQTVSGGTNWKQVSCGGVALGGGEGQTGAIKTDGTLWMWGNNGNGQLGTNDRVHRSSPVQTVSGGANWSQVSCGAYISSAIKIDGTLWLWGSNFYGNLGIGTSGDRSSPIQTVSGGTNWKQVSCSGVTVGAIKTDGSLWLWGFGRGGQLGNEVLTDVNSPVQTISGGYNWKQVATSDRGHVIAIRDESDSLLS